MKTPIERGSLATALGLLVHYLCHYLFAVPLFTEIIGEWIMARTPNTYSVLLLETMGPWAKPFALTGGLFALGFAMTIVALSWRYIAILPVAAAYYLLFGLASPTFWLPALAALWFAAPRVETFSPSRRRLLSAVMSSTTIAVARRRLPPRRPPRRPRRQALRPLEVQPPSTSSTNSPAKPSPPSASTTQCRKTRSTP